MVERSWLDVRGGKKSGNEEQQSGADKLSYGHSAEANTNPTFNSLSTIDKPAPC